MRTDELDFELPPELIAQTPTPERAGSRLLHYRRFDRSIAHRYFNELPFVLNSGDLLVFNDARVVPARFTLQKLSGGRVEGLFLGETEPGRWDVMLRNLGSACANMVLKFMAVPEVQVRVLEVKGGGIYHVAVEAGEPALTFLSRVGRMPLPPYIKRSRDVDARDEFDRQRYQTVYAQSPGAVAAPTAGLHFSERIFQELTEHGIERTFVTLHVGLGTFKPVTTDNLEEHDMHSEAYTIPPAAADAINRARSEKRRVIAVGTTSARVLESQPADQPIAPVTAETSIFIYPPYRWRHVDAMVTNFHLPRSTLIAMIASLVGLDEQRRIYQTAIDYRYRFFSYGDAMLIE